ncbi:hypothetical protein CORC01_11849 [Colletotrichum orchidophilum]|uniref:Zn(2)-C6 fungal-type domain-containing protein n=1 Tax=Colletotrichum orchidophilum TaxID=1209926 RepID=A0A1G4AUT7_9PEZI|nr:uncharacterized protein CORC01_11849 [Colletotrichum orchidophilum]OHE92843.1 hypothetical protein CORC01_11849 [Colletotrichum orchidophilum]
MPPKKSNLVPDKICLPTFRQTANTNNGSSSQQPPAQAQQSQPPQRQQRQYESFTSDIDLGPLERYNLQGQEYGTDAQYPAQRFPANANTGFNFPPAGSSSTILPNMPQPQAQFPMTSFMPTRDVRLPPAQYIEPSNQQYTYNYSCTTPLQPQPSKRRLSDVASGREGGREGGEEDGPERPAKKTRRAPAPDLGFWQPALFRKQPSLEVRVPIDNVCDHCRAGGHQNQGCNADFAAQIECNQCCRYRNLTDPNHVCRVLDREYWQKRFANSRPSYPTHEEQTSCCARCKERRGSGRPALCDMDDRVKIGCTPCKNDRVLCRAYNERKARGVGVGVDQPAELMWNRPDPADGSVSRERRPWWRHMCQACQSQGGRRKAEPCSWIKDFRLGDYKCAPCVENNIPCVDPWTGQEYATPYLWTGQGDKIIYDKTTVARKDRNRCTNCATNQANCRGFIGEGDFACIRCTSWGLTCELPGNGSRHPPQELPVMDRKMIGWPGGTKHASDKGMTFRGCKRCRQNGLNCDRKRPCDKCFSQGAAAECDSWVLGKELCKRDQTLGDDAPEYYMALGYGPRGVDDDRAMCLEDRLVGPNMPKHADMMERPPAPVPGEAQSLEGQPVQRQFGGAVGNGYATFFGGDSGVGGTAPPPRGTAAAGYQDVTAPSNPLAFFDPAQPYGNQDHIRLQHNNMMYGDNNAAAKATETGEGFSNWLGNYNQSRHQAGPNNQDFNAQAPFEGQPRNQNEIQYMLGSSYSTSSKALVQMAESPPPIPIDPQLQEAMDVGPESRARDDREQSEITRDISGYMANYARATRFVPIELRNFNPPEVAQTPSAARIGPPLRVLLELKEQPADESPRQPPPPPSWNPPPYDPKLRDLLSRWKKPSLNVFHDVPDAPLASGQQPHDQPCEEVKPGAPDNICKQNVPDGAFCENQEHVAARPKQFVVCNDCNLSSKKTLFEGPHPLMRAEFLNMRNYACGACAITNESSAAFGTPEVPLNPVTGCLCAAKLLGRRLCQHHRYQLAQRLMVQVSLVLEWAITNFGPNMCLFCKQDGVHAKGVESAGDKWTESLVYVCLNCEGVVRESVKSEIMPGIQAWMGGSHPFSLFQEPWMPMEGVEQEGL